MPYTNGPVTERRAVLGITQAEAARRAGVSLATWRRFEQSPSLDYRAETISGVMRALRWSRDELHRTLGDASPVVVDISRPTAWVVEWNRRWADRPAITARMAASIQAAMNSSRDFLEDSIDSPHFDPEDQLLLSELDPRVFIALGPNPSWFRAAARRLRHMVEAMQQGQLVDEAGECFADFVLFGAAVRLASEVWDDEQDAGIFADLSDDFLVDTTDPETGFQMTPAAAQAEAREMRWDLLDGSLDDLTPYREWSCAFAGSRLTALLLQKRPPHTWFDEPDEELQAFRDSAPHNLLAQDLTWTNDDIRAFASRVAPQTRG